MIKLITIAAVGALMLAGCGGGNSTAELAAEHGEWCNAATLEPKSTHYAAECNREREYKETTDVLRKRQAEENANQAEHAVSP
jgi:hypothetical protein